MELEVNTGFLVTSKPRHMTAVVHEFATLRAFEAVFWPRMAVSGPNQRRFGRAPPNLAWLPRAANRELGAQTPELGRLCVNAKMARVEQNPKRWHGDVCKMERRNACLTAC